MKRASIFLCLACITAAPGCASKSSETPAVEPSQAASPSDIGEGATLDSQPAPKTEIEKIQIAVRTHHLDTLIKKLETQAARWTGVELSLTGLAASMTGGGALSSVDLGGRLSLDAAYPQPGQQARPEDLEFQSFVPSDDPQALIAASESMQPLGEGLWRLTVDDDISALVREEAAGITFATDLSGLDRARSEHASAEALDPRFQLQVEVTNFPRDSIDPDALLNIRELRDAKTLAKVIQELTGLRLQLGVLDNDTLQVVGRASAPYDSLGLSALGPARTEASKLTTALPGGAILSAVLSMSNAKPAIQELNSLAKEIGEVPPPFDEAVDGTLNAVRGILRAIEGEVAVSAYLTKKREIAVVIAAQTPNADASRDAIRALMLEVERALKTHIALVGEDPNERYSASFKPDGLGFSKARADILAIDLSKAMTADLPKSSTLVLGKKRNRVEFLSYVEGDASLIAFGPGARTIMSDYLRGLKSPRASSIESLGGLGVARDVTGGCQLCVVVNPYRIAEVVTVIDKLEPRPAKRLEPLREIVKQRSLDAEISIGATLSPQHAALGISLPGALVAPSDEVVQLTRELLASDDEAEVQEETVNVYEGAN
jgi:hypothetical protein